MRVVVLLYSFLYTIQIYVGVLAKYLIILIFYIYDWCRLLEGPRLRVISTQGEYTDWVNDNFGNVCFLFMLLFCNYRTKWVSIFVNMVVCLCFVLKRATYLLSFFRTILCSYKIYVQRLLFPHFQDFFLKDPFTRWTISFNSELLDQLSFVCYKI